MVKPYLSGLRWLLLYTLHCLCLSSTITQEVFAQLTASSTTDTTLTFDLNVEVECLLDSGKYLEAIEISKYLIKHIHPSFKHQIAESWYKSGLAHLKNAAYFEAIHSLDSSLKILNQIKDSSLLVAQVYEAKANASYFISDYKQYLQNITSAKSIRLILPDVDPLGLGAVYSRVGAGYEFLGRYDSAVFYAKKGLETFLHARDERLKDSIDYDDKLSNIYNNLGNVYVKAGLHQESITAHSRALAMRLHGNASKKNLYSSYNGLGLVHQNLGRYKEALKFYLSSVDAIKSYHRPPSSQLLLALVYENLCAVLGYLNECNKAIEYGEKAIAIKTSTLGPDHPSLGTAYSQLVISYYKIGDYSQALQYSEKSIYAYEKLLGKDHPFMADVYANMSSIMDRIGDFDASIEYQKKAIEIARKETPSNLDKLGGLYFNLGITYELTERHNEALEFTRRAINHVSGPPFPPDERISAMFRAIGNVHFSISNYDSASFYINQSLTVLGYGGKQPDYSQLLSVSEFAMSLSDLARTALIRYQTGRDTQVLRQAVEHYGTTANAIDQERLWRSESSGTKLAEKFHPAYRLDF